MGKNIIFEKLKRFLPIAFLTVILLMVFVVVLTLLIPVERERGAKMHRGEWGASYDMFLPAIEESGIPGEYGTMDYGVAMPETMPMPPVYFDDVSGSEDEDISDAPRQVVRNGTLAILVGNMEDAVSVLKGVAAQFDGRVDNVWYEQRGNTGKKYATVVIRVPNEKFDSAMEEAKKIALKVNGENISTVDVTETAADTDARIANLEREEERYQEILEQAESTDEILQVSRLLRQVRGEIERLEARKNLLVREIAMSTITISLESEPDIAVAAPVWSPWSTVKLAFLAVLSGIAAFADFMIFFVVLLLPLLVLWGGLIYLLIWIVWKFILSMKRHMVRHNIVTQSEKTMPVPTFNSTTRSFPTSPSSVSQSGGTRRKKSNGSNGNEKSGNGFTNGSK